MFDELLYSSALCAGMDQYSKKKGKKIINVLYCIYIYIMYINVTECDDRPEISRILREPSRGMLILEPNQLLFCARP